MAVQRLGGHCARCGFAPESMAQMQLHHRDPREKEFSLSAKGATISWERVSAEADKCVLLCSNCHAHIHAVRDADWLAVA